MLTNFFKDLTTTLKQALGIKEPQDPYKLGFYSEVITMEDGQKKFLTRFPKGWTKKKIEKRLREAYKDAMNNPDKQDKSRGLIGHTKEGIPIRFWLEIKNTSKIVDGELVTDKIVLIKSFYPEI